MSKRAQIVGSDLYEELASAYQFVLAANLEGVLRECGIKPKRKRREICQAFLYYHSMLHDQSWLRSGKNRVYPIIGFAEGFQNVGMSPKAMGRVIVDKDKLFSFDEYSWSVLRLLFEPEGDDRDIQVGLVGDQESETPEAEVPLEQSDTLKVWRLNSGLEFCCWTGGDFHAGDKLVIWSSLPSGTISFRIRKGAREIKKDWTRMTKRKPGWDGDPTFRGSAILPRGEYAVDFRVSQEVFSELKVVFK